MGCIFCKVCMDFNEESSRQPQAEVYVTEHETNDVLPLLNTAPSQGDCQRNRRHSDKSMISIACPIPRAVGEDSDQHARCRGRCSTALAKNAGMWSKHWFNRAVSWDSRVRRNCAGCECHVFLIGFHDAIWLQSQRFAFAPFPQLV